MSAVEIVAIVAVVLLGVLVGFAAPALIQLRATLRSAQVFLETTGRKLDRTLDEAAAAIARLDRLGAEAEHALSRLRGFLDTVEELVASAAAARDAVRKLVAAVSAVGPALAAGLRAFWPHDGVRESDRRPAEAETTGVATGTVPAGKEMP